MGDREWAAHWTQRDGQSPAFELASTSVLACVCVCVCMHERGRRREEDRESTLEGMEP